MRNKFHTTVYFGHQPPWSTTRELEESFFNFLTATIMALLLAQKAPIMTVVSVGNAWKFSFPHPLSQPWARWAWVWLHSPLRFWYGRWSPSCARRSPFFPLRRLGPSCSIPRENSSSSEVRCTMALNVLDIPTNSIMQACATLATT